MHMGPVFFGVSFVSIVNAMVVSLSCELPSRPCSRRTMSSSRGVNGKIGRPSRGIEASCLSEKPAHGRGKHNAREGVQRTEGDRWQHRKPVTKAFTVQSLLQAAGRGS